MSTNRAPQEGAITVTVDDPRQRRAVLVGVCIALMAVIASVSGLNVAQPEIALEFDASQSTVMWIINIYTISLAALLLPLGAVGDRWGRKPVLLTGLTLFGVANLAAQPSSIASNTAVAGSRCTTPLASTRCAAPGRSTARSMALHQTQHR